MQPYDQSPRIEKMCSNFEYNLNNYFLCVVMGVGEINN